MTFRFPTADTRLQRAARLRTRLVPFDSAAVIMMAVPQPVLRRAVHIALLAGAAGSVGLSLYAGRHNPSMLLRLLFAVWVLSPYVAALWATVTERWSVAATALNAGALLIVLGSLSVYGPVAFGYIRAKIGFVFLMVPLASWLVLGAAVAVGR
jgi:hypothetical protein